MSPDESHWDPKEEMISLPVGVAGSIRYCFTWQVKPEPRLQRRRGVYEAERKGKKAGVTFAR